MRCLILISLITLTFASIKIEKRIIGGYDIPIEKVPYQVSIEIKGEHRCGGAIVTPIFIVSAAHCFQEFGPKHTKVRAGSSTRGNGGQLVNVKKINSNSKFDVDDLDYDVAILELNTPLDFGESVAKIALPSKDKVWPSGTDALISGWGYLKQSNKKLPENLQGATVHLIDHEFCVEAYSDSLTITERMFCAGFKEGGVDACTADSGGPLQIDGILAGIVSFGVNCGKPGHPGIYTNVSVVLDYIQGIID